MEPFEKSIVMLVLVFMALFTGMFVNNERHSNMRKCLDKPYVGKGETAVTRTAAECAKAFE